MVAQLKFEPLVSHYNLTTIQCSLPLLIIKAQYCHIESLHLPLHHMTAAVLSSVMKDTHFGVVQTMSWVFTLKAEY